MSDVLDNIRDRWDLLVCYLFGCKVVGFKIDVPGEPIEWEAECERCGRRL